jgi:hypothetical protein
MAFVLDLSDSYSWPVTVKVPQDGGRFRSYAFDVEFLRVSQERREELGRQLAAQQNRVDAGDLEGELLTPRSIAQELVVGWSGILTSEGKGGEEVPYSEATKAQLLNVPDVADAILQAWQASIPGAKAKN